MKIKHTFPALLLFAALLVSCGQEATAPTETDSVSETTPVTEAVTEAPRDSLPDDLDFGGTTVNLFMRNDMPLAEFDITEDSGDIVDSAIFQRNSTVAERLNVTFNHIGHPCAWGDIPNFTAQVEKSVLAGDGAYDIVGAYSMALADLTVADLMYDISNTKYLDLKQPWWSKLYLEQSYVGDHLYFVSGDISANMTYYTYTYFFNKTMIEKFDLDNPYELVKNGTWTLDKLSEMTKGIYNDLNNNGKKDKDDQYGSLMYTVFIDSMYWGSGLTVLSQDKNGNLRISDDLMSEKTVDVITKVLDLYTVSPDHYFSLNYEQTFHNGNVLFTVDEMHYAINNLRDVTFDFGVVPTPKYDEAQESYYTTSGAPVFMYGMPTTIADPDMASAVLEALASESYYNLTPVLFETAMKVKYSRDTESAQMFDIIRDSRMTDPARIFGRSLNNIYAVFRFQIEEKNQNWASNYEKHLKEYQTSIDKLNENFSSRS